MNYRINTDKTAAVATDVFWKPIDKSTPWGVRTLAINKHHGVAVVTQLHENAGFTHWHPLPKFGEENALG